jgi:hypothetical protein
MLGKFRQVNIGRRRLINERRKYGKSSTHIQHVPFIKDGLMIMRESRNKFIQFQISYTMTVKVTPLRLNRNVRRVGHVIGVMGIYHGKLAVNQKQCKDSKCHPMFHFLKYSSRRHQLISYECEQAEFYFALPYNTKMHTVCRIQLPRGCKRRELRYENWSYLLKINSVTALCYCINKGEALIYDVSPEVCHRKYVTSAEFPVLVKGIRGHPMYFHLFLNGDLLYVANKPKKHDMLTYFSGEIVFWKRSMGYARKDSIYFMTESHCENFKPFIELYTVDEHNMLTFLHVSSGDLWMIFQLSLNHMRTSRYVLAQFFIHLVTKSVIYPMWGRYMVSFFAYKTREEDVHELYTITKVNITEYDVPN